MLSPALFLSLLLPVSFIYSYVLMRLALRPWEQSKGQHWTERARWSWLARKTRTAVAISVVASSLILRHELFGDVPAFAPVLFCALGGYLTALFFIDRQTLPDFTSRLWRDYMIGMLMVTSAWVSVIMWVIISTGDHLEQIDWLRLVVATLLLLIIFSGVWVLALPGLDKNPHTPRLRQMVDSMTNAAGVSSVRAFVGDSFMANAFALMYIRCIMVTAPAMKVLDDDELRMVLRHEMAHLSESLPVLCMRMLGSLSWLGFAFTRPVMHQFGTLHVLWIFLGVLLVRRWAAATAKKMESRADSMSVTHSAEGPVYARALEKLHEVNQIPAVLPPQGLVHPHLYDRMLAAGLTPDYPRPDPPPRRHWTFDIALIPIAIWVGCKLAANTPLH